MVINKLILQLMKDNGITQMQMANMIGKKRPNDVSARLNSSNMLCDKVIEMLSVMGYELVVQKSSWEDGVKKQYLLEKSDKVQGGVYVSK